MSSINTITSVHIKKLGHSLDEIRLRALDSIISKFDLGFGCDCEAVKKELILKLFNWFTFPNVPQPEKVLDLLLRLIQENGENYTNAFGRLRFQNEIRELRAHLDPALHNKLYQIEAVATDTNNSQRSANMEVRTIKRPGRFVTSSTETADLQLRDIEASNSVLQSSTTKTASLISTSLFDPTLQCGDGTHIDKKTDGGIRWLVMPWQPLVTSDRGVLAAIEEALHNVTDTTLILHTCQFITNVMLQDFPAEVFLQRPAIVTVLHNLITANEDYEEGNFSEMATALLKTLYKLTRSLRFRVYYYCDPCVANKKQKLLAENVESATYPSSEERDSPDPGLPEVNYQAYQSTGTSERSQSIVDNIEDTDLQSQQMTIPTYCIQTLKNILLLLGLPIDPAFPLTNVMHVTDLASELIRLLNISLLPNIWLCGDSESLKVNESLKTLLNLLGEIIEYLASYSSLDHCRVTYLQLVCITTKLLSNLVPLELADLILAKPLKHAIVTAVMDAPTYLMYPDMHTILQEYARQFHGKEERESMKLFDETCLITKSMEAAISLMKNSNELPMPVALKKIYASKLCFSYHKNFNIIKQAVSILQNLEECRIDPNDKTLATKLVLNLLANNDVDVQLAMYVECHKLVVAILGVTFTKGKHSWSKISFLLEPSVLVEIICHGLGNENLELRNLAEEIIVYLLKAKIQFGEEGWRTFLEVLSPAHALLQCFASTKSTLGSCVLKMLDPDLWSSIQIPYIEVLKGNTRLLFAINSDVREEAVCRLIWLLGKETNSVRKLPRLSSLHGLPLSSVCIIDRNSSIRQSQGNYQKSSLLSVIEMLNAPGVDPKMRKSALVQISVMLTDSSLHSIFINENGLELILKIFDSALIEQEYTNYPDSVIPILTILKLICSMDSSTRHELAGRPAIYLNILRSLFLFPNNDCVKNNGSHLLCLLLYSDYILRVGDKETDRPNPINVSLPYIVVARMRLPFTSKCHWKTSIHRCPDLSVLHSSNEKALTFVRQYWAWEWNDKFDTLWKSIHTINNTQISERLMIHESEFTCLQLSSVRYCCQQQLYNIQNSTTHGGVICALDFLTVYLKLYDMSKCTELSDVTSLPWEQSFERFLLSYPTNSEDSKLFVHVLSFLYSFVNITKSGSNAWLCKIMKNMTKSLSDLLRNLDTNTQDAHQAILKLARACSATESTDETHEKSKDESWINFIELVVSNLCFGDQQHFYNLAYLDWLLSCLSYLTGKCQWNKHKNLLISLGNALIELIISFHGAGTYSYMGLSITRNSILCLNHLLYQMQQTVDKNTWATFWYNGGSCLSWLPMLWQNRDPLVRASALQLLAGLTAAQHTAVQLLNAVALAPNELCHALLDHITNRMESCIVREQAAVALSNVLRNCKSSAYQYADSLKSEAILIFAEQSNIYYEISLICSNIYLLSTLDPDPSSTVSEEVMLWQSEHSGTFDNTLLSRKHVTQVYNCHEEYNLLSGKDSEITEEDNTLQFVSTPSLITAICTLLTDLIHADEHNIIRQLYEHSIDKYFFGCFKGIPQNIESRKGLVHYCDVIEMYTGLCTVITKCVTHNSKLTTTVNFSPDSLYLVISLLNHTLYYTQTPRLVYLRNQLWTEIYKLLAVLAISENQCSEAVQSAIELCGPELVVSSMCIAIKNSTSELQMSAIGSLASLLSYEVQSDVPLRKDASLKVILDTSHTTVSDRRKQVSLRDIVSDVNKLSIKNVNMHLKKLDDGDLNGENICNKTERITADGKLALIGSEICKTLLQLYVAHSYTRLKKNRKPTDDKDLIIGAFTNLLCVSIEAKKTALEEGLPETTMMQLKELYVKLNLQPLELQKNGFDRENKMNPLLHEVGCIFTLLMNFMYNGLQMKKTMAKAGLADILHKLWAWVSMNKSVTISALKLLATFTTHCQEATQSLTLTSTLPGVGLRKTPNTVALIHVMIHLAAKEIEKAGHHFDNHKLHFAFHILRNATHIHECRVSISKSNLLQFFSKIHPMTTKRVKPWPLVEIYCLEFLIDFTYHEEGQISVSKATDGLDVLIQLAKCSSSSIRILAISILRNLGFNMANRPRLLSSVDFINLLHNIFSKGSLAEIGVAGAMLWSLVSNNQKGKLIARNAGFLQSIQEVLGRLTLSVPHAEQEQELVKMLQYLIRILSTSENPNHGN
ncbi:rotatin [Neodiprion fabricii]|uniref:rotatin n=1 Tax=Neodiprion fabricii TaxID=2872261 RepID=UPI001ED93FC7|nr:rotatin [Neodiprion fabricii]XP_046424634.1 rotatin [Neodiprion fabricii]XP_046424635.1 rotatin [Neodiprion fabricii]XP_046424636.1 rotatin [Neodiprion fabricii]